MLLPIENDPRDYAWGRRGAISELLGRPNADAVEAELWLGAHRGSPARLVGRPGTARDVVPDLPFLLKVLATSSPLSIQAHPNAEQARRGFERENAAGVPIDAPERNYRDPFAKPELIVAVSARFEALAGFRPAAESAADLERIADGVGERETVAPLLERLGDDATVGDALAWLLTSEGAAEVVDAVARALAAGPEELSWAARIAESYPGDPGIVGALLLHHVVLAPGEALYLAPGQVHAYLDGIGIELMGPSDNVLRGGLTPKHVDVPELVRVIDRGAVPVPRLAAQPLPGGGARYAPEDPEARLSLAVVGGEASFSLEGPGIALCLEGDFTLRGGVSSIGVGRGDAVLVTAEERVLRIEGRGSLYVAR